MNLPLRRCAAIGLGLVLVFSGRFAESAGSLGMMLAVTMASELEWMKGMPSPPGSQEYLVELRRRVAAGPRVRLRAVYHSFRKFGSSRFGLDREGERTWSVTICQVIAPERFKGWTIPINHTVDVLSGSCWRTEGCAVEFDVNERVVEALHDDVFGFTESIFDSELENLKLDVPGTPTRSPSSAKRAVGNAKSTAKPGPKDP